MSQSTDSTGEITQQELNKAFAGEQQDKEASQENNISNDDELKEDNTDNDGGSKEDIKKPEMTKKQVSKKAVFVILLIFLWVILIGVAILLGFLFRQRNEITPAEEVFKWEQNEEEKTEEIVDVDYYSFYDANSITFEYPYRHISGPAPEYANTNPNYNLKLEMVPQIVGLKDLEVQEKINQKIVDVANSLTVPEDQFVGVEIAANLNNLLSIRLNGSNESYQYNYVGLNLDLKNGEEIGFDDIFTKSANVLAIVYKRFYNEISSNLSFDLLYTERGIQGKESGQCAMWCDPDISLDEYRNRKLEIESKLANIEEIAMAETQKYLNGERKFYLESAGPVFIYDNNLQFTDYFTGEDLRYMAYLTKYKTNESLFVDDSVGLKHYFMSSTEAEYFCYARIEEKDNYFLDYAPEYYSDSCPDYSVENRLVEDLLQEILNKTDKTKYLYIHMDVNSNPFDDGKIYDRSVAIYEMDKQYFDSVFRKAVFDVKNHSIHGPPNHAPSEFMFDKDKVSIKFLQDYDIESAVLVDKDGVVYDKFEDVFLPNVKMRYKSYGYYAYCGQSSGGDCFYLVTNDDESMGKDWKELLVDYFYQNVGGWKSGTFGLDEFTEEEKKAHEFEFELNGSTGLVIVKLKNNDKAVTIPFDKIPKEYIIESLR